MTKRTIIPPKDGWIARSYYLVEVAYNANNPIHPAIFYTGFLSHGNPAGYNEILRTEDHDSIDDVMYMRAIRLLLPKEEFMCHNCGKLITEL